MAQDLQLLQSRARKLKHREVNELRMAILSQQDNRCALCHEGIAELKDACLDHDHKTGFIRGVLCRNCNRGEGEVKTVATRCKRGGTSMNWLMSLVAYWTRHSTPQSNLIHPTHKTEVEKKEIRRTKAKAYRQRKKLEK